MLMWRMRDAEARGGESLDGDGMTFPFAVVTVLRKGTDMCGATSLRTDGVAEIVPIRRAARIGFSQQSGGAGSMSRHRRLMLASAHELPEGWDVWWFPADL